MIWLEHEVETLTSWAFAHTQPLSKDDELTSC
jgi:hypothetical protein